MKRELQAGQHWTHYKHPDREYEIIGVGRDVDNWEQELVIYKALYEDRAPYGQLCVRKIEEFLGKVEANGKIIDRFNRVK